MVRSDHRSRFTTAIAEVDAVSSPVRVAVADRRRLIAEALAALIADREGFAVTGAIVGEALVEAVVQQRPDVVVVGAGADSRPAMDLVRELRRRVPQHLDSRLRHWSAPSASERGERRAPG